MVEYGGVNNHTAAISTKILSRGTLVSMFIKYYIQEPIGSNINTKFQQRTQFYLPQCNAHNYTLESRICIFYSPQLSHIIFW
jgi:hypothetical protein